MVVSSVTAKLLTVTPIKSDKPDVVSVRQIPVETKASVVIITPECGSTGRGMIAVTRDGHVTRKTT